jgi:hypothetical protein
MLNINQLHNLSHGIININEDSPTYLHLINKLFTSY